MRPLAFVVLVATCSQPLWSQGRLDERVSLAFEYSAPIDVFRFIAKSQGYEAIVDPGLTDTVSIRLENVKYRTVLDALCDSVACRWRLEGNRLVIDALPGAPSRGHSGWREEAFAPLRKVVPAGVRFENVPFGEALKSLSKLAGPDVRIVVPTVSEKLMVSADVGSKTVHAAIRSLIGGAGLAPGSRFVFEIRRPGYPPIRLTGITAKAPS